MIEVYNSAQHMNSTPLSPEMPSLFLAGPSLRGDDGRIFHSWRERAIEYLSKVPFKLMVLSPEPFYSSDRQDVAYTKQVHWEVQSMNMADAILFWIPRHKQVLPGFTTNIEFGEWLHSGKIVYGRPDEACKMRYMDERCIMAEIPIYSDLQVAADEAAYLAHKLYVERKSKK